MTQKQMDGRRCGSLPVHLAVLCLLVVIGAIHGDTSMPENIQRETQQWAQRVIQDDGAEGISVQLVTQGWGNLQWSRSINDEPMNIHGRPFVWGLGTHADSEVVLQGAAMTRLEGYVGVDENTASRLAPQLSVNIQIEFWIEANRKELWRSPVMTLKDDALRFSVDTGGARNVTLKCRAVNGNKHLAHGDWAELVAVRQNGQSVKIGARRNDDLLNSVLPLSFVYDRRSSKTLLSGWKKSIETKSISGTLTQHKLSWRDPASGLECTLELKEYTDFPAVEWVAYFRNGGDVDTPILENILPLNLSGQVSRPLTLHRSRGSDSSRDDFTYQRDALEPGKPLVMTPATGRSSQAWLPFFNVAVQRPTDPGRDLLETGIPAEADHGTIVAVGWTGNWSASVSLSKANTLNIQAGLEKTHLRLHPGESIRTPRILLLNWQGRPIDGNNRLRQFILKYHTPKPSGKTLVGPLTNGTWGGMNTSSHLERIAIYAKEKLPYDYYWIDAGWYGSSESNSPDGGLSDWASHVGNWKVNPAVHPQGLKPISDAAHQAGMKFLLWFEPERAVRGTTLPREHPEWFLKDPSESTNVLLNLGLPEARAWLTDFISTQIKTMGIDCYRQDFNMDPLPYWRKADAPDRIGMTEIKHIEGLYAFWDALLAAHPDLVIDNCASGGRRIDLETISRSIPLWRSDVQCTPAFDPDCSQIQTLGLNLWVPLNACGTQDIPGDTYRFRSSLSSAIVFHAFSDGNRPMDPGYPFTWHRKMMQDFLRARPMFTGNFYPLTPFHQSKETWGGYQCHRTDLNSGVVVLFRRPACPYSAGRVPLNELEPSARYEVEDADTGERQIMTGNDLLKGGVPVTLEEPRSSRLLFYRQL